MFQSWTPSMVIDELVYSVLMSSSEVGLLGGRVVVRRRLLSGLDERLKCDGDTNSDEGADSSLEGGLDDGLLVVFPELGDAADLGGFDLLIFVHFGFLSRQVDVIIGRVIFARLRKIQL